MSHSNQSATRPERLNGVYGLPPNATHGAGGVLDYMKRNLYNYVEKMRRLRLAGWSSTKVGNLFGVTRERIRQLTGNMGCRGERTKRFVQGLSDEECLKLTIHDYSKFHCGRSAWRAELSKRHHSVLPESNVSRGQIGERWVSNKLKEYGIDNKLMPVRHPYDILLTSSNQTIDVKTRFNHKSFIPGTISPQWHVCFKKDRSRRADWFVLFSFPQQKCFVIPKKAVESVTSITFCWPTLRPTMSKWSKYLNAFHLLAPERPVKPFTPRQTCA